MKDKFSKWSLPLLWIFAFFIIILMMPFVSHAEEPYFPMEQNKNNAFPDVVQDAIDNRFDSDNNFIFFYTNDINNDGWTRGWVGVIARNEQDYPYFFGEIQNNGYTWNAYSLFNTTIACYKVNANRSTGLLGVTNLGNNQAVFNNMLSSNYTTSTDFISNFRIYTSNVENASVVLRYGNDPNPPLDIGVAIIPPDAIVPEYPTGLTPPSEVPPIFTPNDYQWTTPPTFDGSNVTNAIGSIQNTLGWLANNLKEEFKNITDNWKYFVEYIGKTIQYYGNAILETLNNFIQNFYDNMAALVQPIFEKIAYITEEVDADEINDAFEHTAFYSIKTQFTSVFNIFDNSFDIDEPESFTIIFNVQNITLFYNFGVRSPVTVDLGSNFLPIRSALRTFLWVLVSFGSVFVVEHGLSNWIRGERNS